MSRLSFRPRPLDIHKKLPIVKSIKEFEDDEAAVTNSSAGAPTRNSQLLHHSTEVDNEAHQPPSRKNPQEIPTPQYNVVESYERDYSRTFSQPTSYSRAGGARNEIGEFVEYDLDNEDEDWLEEFNNERKTLTPEKFETILFKLEVLDHKTRERAGVITPTFGAPIPVLLQLDAAVEALQSYSIRFAVFQSLYNYWKAKRERWQKPILRRLQPPPPVNDTNPYNVFRRREKTHRLHTRRMQRRENNVQSFEKLRQVRRNLSQAQTILDALIKREEKKREVMENEVSLQRIQIKYKVGSSRHIKLLPRVQVQNEAQLIEDGVTFPSFQFFSSKFGSSEDDLMDSDDTTNARSHAQPAAVHHLCFVDSKRVKIPAVRMKRELNRRPLPNGWLQEVDQFDPFFLFTRPLEPHKLAAAGIVPPPDPPIENCSIELPYRFHGRMGRGGRIVFDRWIPVTHAPGRIRSSVPFVPPNSRPSPPNG